MRVKERSDVRESVCLGFTCVCEIMPMSVCVCVCARLCEREKAIIYRKSVCLKEETSSGNATR